ncbi:Glutamine--tRNA ligase [Buchnera aphidicola (Tetraneura ulmi)]|uniref:glutamine--tRNA ligase n=1 Tax=Buchnera aphidicola TaxID=9 RepID=UPI003464E006
MKKMQNNFIKKIIDKDLKNKKYLFVRTRFPPEPNGYLHIGHAKTICLNFGIAKNYNGYCNLRFDDTNPKKEKIEFITSIQKDIKWLGFKWHKEPRYTSNYFEKIYEYAIQLIKKNLAYVDLLTKKQIQEYRGTLTKTGKDSPYKNNTIKKNLYLFKKMKDGLFLPGKACLRAKIDMNSSRIVMRDPVLYRIIFKKKNQLTSNKWLIYPTYDFSHCISDSIEGITHSLCTLEFSDNKFLYDWILKKINVSNKPKQYEFSRLQLEYSILSKRKIQILIEKKIVKNWNDPRLATISGLRNRGYTASSIKNFCNKIGITKQESLIEFSFLESCIRKELNDIAPRIMAVLDPIKIIIENYPDNKTEKIRIPNHPKNPKMGFREIFFFKEIYIDRSDFSEREDKKYKRLTLNTKIRLRYAYVIQATKIKKDKNNNIISIYCKYDKNTLGRNPKNEKIKCILHWVSKKKSLKSKFFLYEKLFTIKNPELKKDFLSYINKNSIIVKNGLIDSYISKIPYNKNYQFERIGYFCIEKKNYNKKKWIFNRIVSLRKK